MVATLTRSTSRHTVEWHAPSPLWEVALQDTGRDRFDQPALLRFAADSFMEDLAAVLASDEPADLKNYVARPETWNAEAAGWQTEAERRQQSRALKLYQPAQSRFYLVAAALVCRLPGLPDRKIDPQCQERAAFLMRRWARVDPDTPVDPADPNTYQEMAWVVRDRKGTWTPVAAPQTVLAGEERLPLFALNFKEGTRQRRLLAGYIPVASRDTYAAAAQSPIQPPGAGETQDPRVAQFETRVAIPLITLRSDLDSSKITTADAREVFLFALLDLATLLNQYLAGLWTEITRGQPVNAFVDRWRQSLIDAWNHRQAIADGTAVPPEYDLSQLSTAEVTGMRPWVRAELKSSPVRPGVGDAPTLPKLDPHAGDYYVIRCVYERPCCDKIFPALVSQPTQPFQLAPYFDPEAPARPVRIMMPVDTSIAALRRYKKDVSFVVSDDLRNKLQRIWGKSLEDLKDGAIDLPANFSLGLICTLSIPIITICALIMLMIVINLLNIIFHWLPFLKICFPISLKKE